MSFTKVKEGERSREKGWKKVVESGERWKKKTNRSWKV